eukprot:Skav234632  [mRNA]  locus=scaffold1609:25974:27201:+ [translate_table: standard]
MPRLRMIDGDVEVIFNQAMQTVDDMVMALETIHGNFLIKDDRVLLGPGEKVTTMVKNRSSFKRYIRGSFELSYNDGISEAGDELWRSLGDGR